LIENQFKEMATLIEETEKNRVLDLVDPVEIYQWDLQWNLIHTQFEDFEESFLHGALLLLKDEME
jgi:hypothetical protein